MGSIIRMGFRNDQANPRYELWYFTFRSLMVRIQIQILILDQLNRV